MRDWLEIQFWKVARWLIIKGYGQVCQIESRDFGYQEKCPGCEAGKVLDWIDEQIDLLKN